MTACTPKTLQGHYNFTRRMLYAERSEAFAPLTIFILVVWNFSICLIEPIRLLDVPVYQYRCSNVLVSVQCISAMYLASGLPGLPGYQAHLPGPTRPYQDLPEPNPCPAWASQKTTRWITHFFGSPQKHLQNNILFLTHIWKSKMYVFPEIAKNWQKKCIKVLSSNSWPSKNIHFTV